MIIIRVATCIICGRSFMTRQRTDAIPSACNSDGAIRFTQRVFSLPNEVDSDHKNQSRFEPRSKTSRPKKRLRPIMHQLLCTSEDDISARMCGSMCTVISMEILCADRSYECRQCALKGKFSNKTQASAWSLHGANHLEFKNTNLWACAWWST